MNMAISPLAHPRDRPPRLGARSAESAPTLALAFPPRRPLAAPLERRRIGVPVPRHCLQPSDDLLRGRWAPPVQRPPLQHPLDALRHVQPRPAHGRVDRHDPVGQQPQDEFRRLVPGQVVQYQQHPQRRQLHRQRRLNRQSGLPAFPQRPRRLRCGRSVGQGSQDLRQLLLQPGMRHPVGAGGHPFNAHPAVGGVEQRQHLGRPVAKVLVRLADRIALRPPTAPGVRNGLERPRLIAAPHRQAQRLAQPVSVLD